MSNKQDKIDVEGTLIKALPGLVFDIQLPEEFWWGIIQGYFDGPDADEIGINLILLDTDDDSNDYFIFTAGGVGQ